MTTHSNLKVGEKINICMSIADFCGVSEQGLIFKYNDISLYPNPCTIISSESRCQIINGIGIRARFARTSGSAQCNSCTPIEDYTELGTVHTNSNGVATLQYVVTEKDLDDYEKAIMAGDAYKLVTCIIDPLGQNIILKGACSEALTVSSGIHAYELRMEFRPASWATESQLSSTIEILLPVINTPITVLGYAYTGKNINWQGNYVSLYYNGQSPVIPFAVIAAAIIIGLMGIGIVLVGLSWYKQAQIDEKVVVAKTDAEQAARTAKEQKDAQAKADYDAGKITYEQYQEQLKTNQGQYEETLKVVEDFYSEKSITDIINTIIILVVVGVIIYFIYKEMK